MPLRQVMESISGFREESTRADQQHMAFVDRHRGAAKTIGDSKAACRCDVKAKGSEPSIISFSIWEYV